MASLAPLAGALTRDQAKHLLRRTTFGVKRSEIDAFTGLTVDAAISQLLTVTPAPTAPIDPATGLDFSGPYQNGVNSSQGNLRNYLRSWWMNIMIQQSPNIVEKMVFFFHSHFTSKWGMIGRAEVFL